MSLWWENYETLDSIRLAVTASETGHLVMGDLGELLPVPKLLTD